MSGPTGAGEASAIGRRHTSRRTHLGRKSNRVAAPAAALDRTMIDQLDTDHAGLIAQDGPDAVTSDRLLRHVATLAERDPGTVAATLASYRKQLGLDHVGLAGWLGMNPTQLTTLGLCARPDQASPAFADLVEELARRYGADTGRLAEALG